MDIDAMTEEDLGIPGIDEVPDLEADTNIIDDIDNIGIFMPNGEAPIHRRYIYHRNYNQNQPDHWFRLVSISFEKKILALKPNRYIIFNETRQVGPEPTTQNTQEDNVSITHYLSVQYHDEINTDRGTARVAETIYILNVPQKEGEKGSDSMFRKCDKEIRRARVDIHEFLNMIRGHRLPSRAVNDFLAEVIPRDIARITDKLLYPEGCRYRRRYQISLHETELVMHEMYILEE